MATGNIFNDIPAQLPEELFQTLFGNGHIRIERIVSKGHATADGDWYDQAWDEWVMLLQGQAVLLYGQDRQTIRLKPGDYLLIPAHVKHRVEWTSGDQEAIWLAIHLPS